jgi:hypothetical protein
MKSKNRINRIGLPLLAFTVTTASLMGGTESSTMAPAPAPASAMPDWLKVSGYAAIAYTYTDVDGPGDNETFANGNTPFDAVKVGLEATKGPFSGYASLFYTPGFDSHSSGSNEAGILDAYATFKTGDFTITAGKYLSWLGYEAFDTVNMTQLTYANTGVGAVPAYHSGVKVDYVMGDIGAGFNVSDSIRGDDTFWSGDGEFSDSIGYEGYVVYKGIKKLTIWGGFGYENNDDPAFAGADWQTYDLWASYELTDKLTVAAEIAYHDDRVVEGVQGLAFAKYAFTDKFSLVGRFGIDEVNKGGADNYKYTVSPTYAFNDHFLVRAELSYSDTINDNLFSGVQALLKF